MSQLEWKIGETTESERPADLEIGVLKVKVRRNITTATKTTQEGTKKAWSYEYADMTPSEYETYKRELAQLEAPFAQMIRNNNTAQLAAIAEVYEAQAQTQENQETIMAGLADLYETAGGTDK